MTKAHITKPHVASAHVTSPEARRNRQAKGAEAFMIASCGSFPPRLTSARMPLRPKAVPGHLEA
jgi:hypothetical protein